MCAAPGEVVGMVGNGGSRGGNGVELLRVSLVSLLVTLLRCIG